MSEVYGFMTNRINIGWFKRKFTKEKINAYILLYGLFMSVLYVVLMAYTFMRAFFTPQKAIILTIDRVGEANPEFVLLFVVVPVVIYTGIVLGYRVYRDEIKNSNNSNTTL